MPPFKTSNGGLGCSNTPRQFRLRKLSLVSGANEGFDQCELAIRLFIFLPERRVFHKTLFQICQFGHLDTSASRFRAISRARAGVLWPFLMKTWSTITRLPSIATWMPRAIPSGALARNSPEFAFDMLYVRLAKSFETEGFHHLEKSDEPRPDFGIDILEMSQPSIVSYPEPCTPSGLARSA